MLEQDVNCNDLKIDMKRYSNGIYLIQVATETETMTHKVIVF